ncbi:MAG TPA: protein kinase [Vicinamibacterales bacterium]|nr:protein kinase [Vicinamibacterales bacterium]
MIGQNLGPYQDLSKLGEGGLGEVYKARDTKLGRDVALKVLSGEVSGNPDRLDRFRREAHVLASLNHPNIAAIHGFEDAGETPALVMELVEEPTLAEIIASESPSARYTYQPAPDGQRFLVLQRDPAAAPAITIVLNWEAGLGPASR